MLYDITLNKHRLRIFHEGNKRRIFVGELLYIQEHYELTYDQNYAQSKNAIPIAPNLDLFKKKHVSKKNELFPVFMDRIPLKTNPAYEDYCYTQGISPDENNPIVLLGTIGKRGPSSFIFEPVYESVFTTIDLVKIRKDLELSQHDLAEAFEINKNTLQRIESGKSKDINSLKLLQIYLTFPEVALWQLKQSGGKIHNQSLAKLITYFENQLANKS